MSESEREYAPIEIKPTNLIVCGTEPRKGEPDFTDEEINAIYAQLDVLEANCAKAGRPIVSVTTGAAPRGVDWYATNWAFARGIRYHEFPANWSEHGKSAGPIRNKQMVRETINRVPRDSILVYGFTTKPLEQSRGTSSTLEIAGNTYGLRTHLFRIDQNAWEF